MTYKNFVYTYKYNNIKYLSCLYTKEVNNIKKIKYLLIILLSLSFIFNNTIKTITAYNSPFQSIDINNKIIFLENSNEQSTELINLQVEKVKNQLIINWDTKEVDNSGEMRTLSNSPKTNLEYFILYENNEVIYEGTETTYKTNYPLTEKKPNKVTNIEQNLKDDFLEISLEEPKATEKTFKYKVVRLQDECHSKIHSNLVEINVKDEINHYIYELSNERKDVIDQGIYNNENSIKIKEYNGEKYLNIQSISKSGESSDVSNFPLNNSNINKLKATANNNIYPNKDVFVSDSSKNTINDKSTLNKNELVELSQTPNENVWTNENVVININTSKIPNEIKKVFYKGENMVKNGDFKKGDEHWEITRYGEIIIENGIATLKDDNAPAKRNRMRQLDMFENTVPGASFYAEIEAKGTATLNTRFSTSYINNGQTSYEQEMTSNDVYKTYSFIMDRFNNSLDHLVVEKIGNGRIDIRNIDVYAKKDIINNKLEVDSNGEFTIIVEDHNDNLYSSTIKIENIDKTKPTISINKNNNEVTVKDSLSGLNEVKYAWKNVDTGEITKYYNVTNTSGKEKKFKLGNKPSVIGKYEAIVVAKDLAGNNTQYNSGEVGHYEIIDYGITVNIKNDLNKNHKLTGKEEVLKFDKSTSMVIDKRYNKEAIEYNLKLSNASGGQGILKNLNVEKLTVKEGSKVIKTIKNKPLTQSKEPLFTLEKNPAIDKEVIYNLESIYSSKIPKTMKTGTERISVIHELSFGPVGKI